MLKKLKELQIKQLSRTPHVSFAGITKSQADSVQFTQPERSGIDVDKRVLSDTNGHVKAEHQFVVPESPCKKYNGDIKADTKSPGIKEGQGSVHNSPLSSPRASPRAVLITALPPVLSSKSTNYEPQIIVLISRIHGLYG